MTKTYSELSKLKTFKERYDYLKIDDGRVGKDTFGYDRYLNQLFYQTPEWKTIRDKVIARDLGCDLGIEGHEIYGPIIIHHMNPITSDDIIDRSDILLNPEYLITTTKRTHNAMHYGSFELIDPDPIERNENDTCPWRQK